MSIIEHSEDRFWTNLIIPSANSLKVLAVVTAAWEFTIAEKLELVHLSSELMQKTG